MVFKFQKIPVTLEGESRSFPLSRSVVGKMTSYLSEKKRGCSIKKRRRHRNLRLLISPTSITYLKIQREFVSRKKKTLSFRSKDITVLLGK